MSRIGRMPISVPDGVTVDIKEGNLVTVKGPKGTLERALAPEMILEQKDGEITVSRPNDLKRMKSLQICMVWFIQTSETGSLIFAKN